MKSQSEHQPTRQAKETCDTVVPINPSKGRVLEYDQSKERLESSEMTSMVRSGNYERMLLCKIRKRLCPVWSSSIASINQRQDRNYVAQCQYRS